ncbi:hypothetical protein EUTSA_v10009492mg, partial [Eutrema salsugineum]
MQNKFTRNFIFIQKLKLLTPENWLKCNFDSSDRKGNTTVGVGWIIRDHNGKHITSGNAALRQVRSPLQAEAMGFLQALQVIWIKGFRR